MTLTQTLVGLGEIQVIQGDALFACLGLGSCIALMIADPTAQVAGVAHIMLPRTFGEVDHDRPAKFADTGVKALIEMLERIGGDRTRMKAAFAGGAQVVQGQTTQVMLEFGARNAHAVGEELRAAGIECLGQDVGGHSGRTVQFETRSGKVTVRTPTTQERLLCRIN